MNQCQVCGSALQLLFTSYFCPECEKHKTTTTNELWLPVLDFTPKDFGWHGFPAYLHFCYLNKDSELLDSLEISPVFHQNAVRVLDFCPANHTIVHFVLNTFFTLTLATSPQMAFFKTYGKKIKTYYRVVFAACEKTGPRLSP